MMHRRFFLEYSDMWEYCQKHRIRKWEYRFTFAYGYELIIVEEGVK